MLKVFKCGAGEGRGGSVGPIVLKTKKYYKKPSWKRNILPTVKQRKDNCIGHTLRRNCLLQHVIKGKIEATEGRRGGRKHLLDYLKETGRYWKLKEVAIHRTLQRTS